MRCVFLQSGCRGRKLVRRNGAPGRYTSRLGCLGTNRAVENTNWLKCHSSGGLEYSWQNGTIYSIVHKMIFELVSLVIAYDFIPVVIFGEFTLTVSGLEWTYWISWRSSWNRCHNSNLYSLKLDSLNMFYGQKGRMVTSWRVAWDFLMLATSLFVSHTPKAVM